MKKLKRDKFGAIVKDKNGKNVYLEKEAVLADYINEIKELEKPKWMDEAKEAYKIREKRNLLHAKLVINSDEINEKLVERLLSIWKM